MIIQEHELEKISKLLYPVIFDYKDITLEDIRIKLDDAINVALRLNYYGVVTLVQARMQVVTSDQIEIVVDGAIKYGFIGLDLTKVLGEFLKDVKWLKVVGKTIYLDNDYVESIVISNQGIKIELK